MERIDGRVNFGEQCLVFFFGDTVALTDHSVQLGLIIRLKGAAAALRVYITVENGDVCEIFHAQLGQSSALFAHVQDHWVGLSHWVHYKHFDTGADI